MMVPRAKKPFRTVLIMNPAEQSKIFRSVATPEGKRKTVIDLQQVL